MFGLLSRLHPCSQHPTASAVARHGGCHGPCLSGQEVFEALAPSVLLGPYLLGLLAMIKCSICSYQCDNWYVSNWRLACHIYFSLGRRSLELAQSPSCVALAWHLAGRSTPFGVTYLEPSH
jgi:hypothetical protein